MGRYPFTFLIRAIDPSTDGPGLTKLSWTGGLAAMDPVYGPLTYSTDFSIEKKILKIRQPGNFAKIPLNFFEIMF
jgi:hypothetical protein